MRMRHQLKLQRILFISTLLLMACVILFDLHQTHGSQKIYTVNLIQVMRAEEFVAGKSIQSGIKQRDWMMGIQQAGGKIRSAIQTVAGQAIVIVSPAVVQGATDITKKVLIQLGLPTQIPAKLTIQRNDVLSVPHTEKQEGHASWLTP